MTSPTRPFINIDVPILEGSAEVALAIMKNHGIGDGRLHYSPPCDEETRVPLVPQFLNGLRELKARGLFGYVDSATALCVSLSEEEFELDPPEIEVSATNEETELDSPQIGSNATGIVTPPPR